MATNSADRPHSAGLVMIQMWILLYEINLRIKRFSLTRRTGSTISLSANYSPVHELRCNLQNTIKWFNINTYLSKYKRRIQGHYYQYQLTMR